jgi:hypothetical protein
VRYEVGISIFGGDIVHTSGPWRAGRYPDITIFRRGLKHKLLQGEHVEADAGYRGEPDAIDLPDDGPAERHRMKALVRGRHETCNKRFKDFNILNNRFRHDIEKHGDVFTSVAVLVQISIDIGESLFDVEYY